MNAMLLNVIVRTQNTILDIVEVAKFPISAVQCMQSGKAFHSCYKVMKNSLFCPAVPALLLVVLCRKIQMNFVLQM